MVDAGLGGLDTGIGGQHIILCGLLAGLGAQPGSVGLRQLRLKLGGVEARDHLPLMDLAVEVGIQLGDGVGNLGSDLHRGDGLQGAGGADGFDDGLTPNWGRGELRQNGGRFQPPDARRGGEDDQSRRRDHPPSPLGRGCGGSAEENLQFLLFQSRGCHCTSPL